MTWCKKSFDSSVSSRCWAYTPYDQGWDCCPQLRSDPILRRLAEQEAGLRPIPQWAVETVERSINYLPFCPHEAFPAPYLEVLDVIGRQEAPALVHGCYTASPKRKERMLDYIFCLDAWLAEAEPEQAAAELMGRGSARVGWRQVCAALWDVLGERSELKELLLRRIVHRQRWWCKSCVWDDDHRDRYGHDQFLGDTRDCRYGCYGNPGYNDPYYAELEVPAVRRMESRLAEICPDWLWFRNLIRDSWLCAPKACRFLERALWCVGKERRAVSLPSHPLERGERVPDFLQCDDTYLDAARGKIWVSAFAAGLRAWVVGAEAHEKIAFDIRRRLGEREALTSWLVGLYLRKLEFLNPYGGMEPTGSR